MNKNLYDGQSIYKADLSKLAVGDVLLTRNRQAHSFKGRRMADAIALGAQGHFSHALLCNLPPTFVEAIKSGVSILSLQNCFSHNLRDVQMLRYQNSDLSKAAGTWVETRMGQGYSIWKAIRSVVPNASATDADGKTFCSALVATAYRAAGAPEFLTVDPMKVTPATLERMTCFTNVTDKVFNKILAPGNTEKMTALDGERAASISAQQTVFYQRFCNHLVPRIEVLLRSNPEYNYPCPKTFFECLEFLIRSMNIEVSCVSSDFRAKLEKIDHDAHSLLSNGALDEMLSLMIEVEAMEARRLLETSFLEKPDVGLKDITNIYSATTQQILERSHVFSDLSLSRGVSITWDKWLDLTKRSVDAMRNRAAVLKEVIERIQGCSPV